MKSAGKKLGFFLVVALLVAFVLGWFYINTKGVESLAKLF
jgi:hypothetical protein